jgi:hypothetical protein
METLLFRSVSCRAFRLFSERAVRQSLRLNAHTQGHNVTCDAPHFLGLFDRDVVVEGSVDGRDGGSVDGGPLRGAA